MRAVGNVNCIHSIILQFYQAISKQYIVLCYLFCNTDQNVGHQFRSNFIKNREFGERAQSPHFFVFRKLVNYFPDSDIEN